MSVNRKKQSQSPRKAPGSYKEINAIRRMMTNVDTARPSAKDKKFEYPLMVKVQLQSAIPGNPKVMKYKKMNKNESKEFNFDMSSIMCDHCPHKREDSLADLLAHIDI